MAKFKLTADFVEVNRYKFMIEAETEEEAIQLFNEWKKENVPYPQIFSTKEEKKVRCYDAEFAYELKSFDKVVEVLNENKVDYF